MFFTRAGTFIHTASQIWSLVKYISNKLKDKLGSTKVNGIRSGPGLRSAFHIGVWAESSGEHKLVARGARPGGNSVNFNKMRHSQLLAREKIWESSTCSLHCSSASQEREAGKELLLLHRFSLAQSGLSSEGSSGAHPRKPGWRWIKKSLTRIISPAGTLCRAPVGIAALELAGTAAGAHFGNRCREPGE